MKKFTSSAAALHLPVDDRREEIIAMVDKSAITILVAETGAGKSTRVPRFLAEEGWRVIVTQPRKLAARTVAQRVAYEDGTRLGERVGYRTAEDKCDSAATEILFCTDGLQLVRELVGGTHAAGGRTVLVLDEVHEWNLNIEVLVSWARLRIAEGDDLRVVLMSATLDADRLAAFYGEGTPIIKIEGRLFPVERRTARAVSLTDEAGKLAEAGRNVLVFQPGKKEIGLTVDSLKSRFGDKALVLPLHGELSPEEQQRCFAPAPAGVAKIVVATNVAQTSITIPDIDAVVDSGIERRTEVRDGVEGLYLGDISRADCEQRAGRAGRTKEGMYVLCSDTSWDARPAFPQAEILRSRLDQMVLRLGIHGFDATKMEFFHQPSHEALAGAKKSLLALGAMTLNGAITPIGRKMARLGVSVQYARMLVEAEARGVVEEVATIAACLEAGDIRARNFDHRSSEKRSDMLHILDLFQMAQSVRPTEGQSKADALKEQGIFAKDFFRASEIRRKILDSVRVLVKAAGKTFANSEERREQVLRSCVAGMVDHLYEAESLYDWSYRNGSAGTRDLARESVIRKGSSVPKWIVGIPFDLQIVNRKGRRVVMSLVTMATAVDPAWAAEVAPQLVEVRKGLRPSYDASQDTVTSVTETWFNGQKIKEDTLPDAEHAEAGRVFAGWLVWQTSMGGTALEGVFAANAARQKRAEDLNVRAGERVFVTYSLYSDERREHFVAALSGARRISEITDTSALALPALDEELVALVSSENPDTIELLGAAVPVEYRSGTAPKVTLQGELVGENRWLGLPDEAVRLLGGRSIELVISLGGYGNTVSGSGEQLPALKEKVREHLNRKSWDVWSQRSDRPAIVVPDHTVETAEVGAIVEAEYGRDVVSGNPLFAYGTAKVHQPGYYDSNKSWFRAEWYRDRSEAETAQAAAVAKLAELKDELFARQEMELLRAQAEAVRTAASKVYDRYAYDREIDGELRQRLSDVRYASFPASVEGLKQWIASTEGLMAAVERAAAEIQRQKDEEAAALLARVASGEVLVDFSAWHRRGGVSGNGDGWVIQSDGSSREHDRKDGGNRHDGQHIWSFVKPDELALLWSCGTMRDVTGSSTFTVAKVPVNGCSQEQLDRVAAIEDELGTPRNAFGLHPEAQGAYDDRMDAIVEACRRSRILAIVPEGIEYLKVSGPQGQLVFEQNIDWDQLNAAGRRAPYDAECEGREAQTVDSQSAADGVLEFLAYEKWGHWNLNIRWRPLREDERQAKAATSPKASETGETVFKMLKGGVVACETCGPRGKLTGENLKKYSVGEAVPLKCGGCGKSGYLQKK